MPRRDGTGWPGSARRRCGRRPGAGRRRGSAGRGRSGQGRGRGRSGPQGLQNRGLVRATSLATVPVPIPSTGSGMFDRAEQQARPVDQQPCKECSGRGRPPGGRAHALASVDQARCTPCGACQAVCPSEALSLGEDAVIVNADRCCGCGACVEVCPSGALALV
jgi:ferredoxin